MDLFKLGKEGEGIPMECGVCKYRIWSGNMNKEEILACSLWHCLNHKCEEIINVKQLH